MASSLPAYAATVEGFRAFLESLWPEAEARGVSRATFDGAFKTLEPDFKIPDLELPGRKPDGSKGQAEFTRAPGDYLDKAYLANLAQQGRKLMKEHAAALAKIEEKFGVDRYSVLAIWGRETAFGQHKLPHDAIQVLATLAYTGRRKELFRNELLEALRMLEAGVARKDMRASWAGAVGLTQFMPSEYFVHAQDLDGDGVKDIFRSVDDALASAAAQLHGKGWVRGQVWGHEVVIPKSSDCGFEGPSQARPISAWVDLGYRRADGEAWSAAERATDAYLMSPAGAYGPSFLVFENYKVIRRYNTSDLYAVFVGHLADRISGGGDFARAFGGTGPQKTAVIEEIQRHLQKAGFEVDKIDGKVGSNTRKNIGQYQRAQGLKVDCWPSDAVLAHMRSSASEPTAP
ncbi:MAG: lytic murein transglycosylase [Hyphomicrobium sp.]|nr:lytic murein transglycosylase [Hyphomicrobium sp.]